MSTKKSIWVVTEGIIGTENQCLGIAAHLNGDITVKRIKLKWPYRLWSPYSRLGEGPGMLAKSGDQMAAPWPDIVIAGGRKAIGIARYIRRASNGQTFVCIVQNPHVPLDDFDLAAMPYHDAPSSGLPENLIITNGAPGRITPALLDEAHAKWHDLITALPVPRIAALIGGSSKTHIMNKRAMDRVIRHLTDLRGEYKTSLMITVSRRTPAHLVKRLEKTFTQPGVILYTGQGENPYHGFLAYADYIVCSDDSTSMISDAATTGRPVDIIPLPKRKKSARHDRFMTHLHDLGIGIDCREYAPWRDAENVARRIEELMEQRKTEQPG